MTQMNLQSSVNEIGETVTQIIIFKDGIIKTYKGIITSSINEGKFTKFKTVKGQMIMINTSNVLCVEVYNENNI
jgi:hypothetical protein